jgi:hypothetical protein
LELNSIHNAAAVCRSQKLCAFGPVQVYEGDDSTDQASFSRCRSVNANGFRSIAMTQNVLVIPATVTVGKDFPQFLPLANGDVKAATECTRAEVGEAITECRGMARASRERLEAAYQEHLRDLELLAQVSAYYQRYDKWGAIREGREVEERLWPVEESA